MSRRPAGRGRRVVRAIGSLATAAELFSACAGLAADASGSLPVSPACELRSQAQKEQNWCWAAVGQSTMEWMDCLARGPAARKFPQHRQVADRYLKSGETCIDSDCGDQLSACRKAGWPMYEMYGFNGVARCEDGSGLAWHELRAELEQGRPAAYAWRSLQSWTGHLVLLLDFTAGPRGVTLLGFDPSPPCEGNARWALALEDYRAGAGRTHWRTYFSWGAGPKECVSDGGVGDPKRPLLDSPRDAVREALADLGSVAASRLRQHLRLAEGPEPTEESARATAVRLGALTPEQVCATDSQFLTPQILPRELHLSRRGDEVLGVEVDGSAGRWRLGAYEVSRFTHRLVQEVAASGEGGAAACALVRISGLNRRLLWCDGGVARSICDLDAKTPCHPGPASGRAAASDLLRRLREDACAFEGGAPS